MDSNATNEEEQGWGEEFYYPSDTEPSSPFSSCSSPPSSSSSSSSSPTLNATPAKPSFVVNGVSKDEYEQEGRENTRIELEKLRDYLRKEGEKGAVWLWWLCVVVYVLLLLVLWSLGVTWWGMVVGVVVGTVWAPITLVRLGAFLVVVVLFSMFELVLFMKCNMFLGLGEMVLGGGGEGEGVWEGIIGECWEEVGWGWVFGSFHTVFPDIVAVFFS